MTHLKATLFSLLIILCLSDCSSDSNQDVIIQDTNPTEPYELNNIPYGNDDDQVFDMYLPANRTPDTKVMILIHGGGWLAGDKQDMAGYLSFLKVHFPNVAIINMNYRLADENNSPHPMELNDITSVINFLKENKEHYVMSDRFGFIGASAGAHLALLWSYDFDAQHNIDMVCSIVGPTNFTDPVYTDSEDEIVQLLIATIGGDNPTTEYFEEVSPYHRVTAAAPPTILFYGGDDTLVPPSQGTAMRDKLKTLGVPNEFTLYDGEGHGWEGENLEDTALKLEAFMNTYFVESD